MYTRLQRAVKSVVDRRDPILVRYHTWPLPSFQRMTRSDNEEEARARRVGFDPSKRLPYHKILGVVRGKYQHPPRENQNGGV